MLQRMRSARGGSLAARPGKQNSPAPPRIAAAAVILVQCLLLALGSTLAAGAREAIAQTPSAAASRPANRLAGEASPYLRQHAYNPVDWYPWGQEAFEKARREGKPIFLSVGYATCHWCHVMARESFENEGIAALLNQHVVSIKVDRERHPEVDQIYMLATELIAEHAGWPNSVFLTPDLEPFFAATYMPTAAFEQIVVRIAQVWREERHALEADAERIAAAISRILTARVAARAVTREDLARAREAILAELDPFNGGLGVAPKFPREPLLLAMLHFATRDGDEKALQLVTLTLDHILDGGIHDQLGGGFHRYAVDEAWRIPHFEKMLYNQALMTRALVRAWQATGEPRYADGARRALDFVLAELTSAEGAFYSALDAETDGKEGAYYLWTPAEIRAALGSDAELLIKAYGVTAAGDLEGGNVLHLPEPAAEQAPAERLSETAFRDRLRELGDRLLQVRALRPRPRRDEKMLASWNGAMIAAFAEAGHALGEPRYVAVAERAARFVWERLGGAEGRLQRAYFDGRADLDATQADHAHLALGLIALFDVTGEPVWLDRTASLAESMITRFLDTEAGDFYLSASADGFVRAKQRDDAELSSANAAALELLTRLARRHLSPEWRHRADALAAALSGLAMAMPIASASALMALDVHERGEAGPVLFAGKGAVRISVRRDGPAAIVELAIAPGWHVNADKPLDRLLVPTRLLPEGGEGVAHYPEPIRRKLSFQSGELALYEGHVLLRLEPAAATSSIDRMRLELQPCSDRICLDPETLLIRLPAAAIAP